MANIPGDIIFFIVMAVVLLVQFSSILGKDDHKEDNILDKVKSDLSKVPDKQQIKEMINVAKDVNFLEISKDVFNNGISKLNKNVQQGIKDISEQDKKFEVAGFLKGAITAFGMIVFAYSKGNLSVLKNMLDDDLFEAFKVDINKRSKKEFIDTKIDKLNNIVITKAKLQGSMIYITVKFITEQTTAIRDEDGQVLKGDPEQPHEITDIWTFARDLRSDNPNWILVNSES